MTTFYVLSLRWGNQLLECYKWILYITPDRGRGLLLGILGSGVRPVLQILTLFQTKYTRFQTWSLRLEQQHKRFLKFHFEFAYTPVVPSKTILDSRPKWAKSIPVFKPKRRKKKPYPTGRHIPAMACTRKNPPPPGHNTPLVGTGWKDL